MLGCYRVARHLYQTWCLLFQFCNSCYFGNYTYSVFCVKTYVSNSKGVIGQASVSGVSVELFVIYRKFSQFIELFVIRDKWLKCP